MVPTDLDTAAHMCSEGKISDPAPHTAQRQGKQHWKPPPTIGVTYVAHSRANKPISLYFVLVRHTLQGLQQTIARDLYSIPPANSSKALTWQGEPHMQDLMPFTGLPQSYHWDMGTVLLKL